MIKLPTKEKNQEVMMTVMVNKEKKKKMKKIAKKKGLKLKEIFDAMIDTLIEQEG